MWGDDMDNGYIVRFVLLENKPNEEYFYSAFEEAKIHFEMFSADNSKLYKRIEVFCYATPNTIELEKVF